MRFTVLLVSTNLTFKGATHGIISLTGLNELAVCQFCANKLMPVCPMLNNFPNVESTWKGMMTQEENFYKVIPEPLTGWYTVKQYNNLNLWSVNKGK